MSGQEFPLAVMEYIRHNDVAILEGCDKVCIAYGREDGGACQKI